VNLVLLLALTGLMQAMRSFSTSNDVSSIGATLAFGYLLIAAFFVGGFFRSMSLPKLTGYLATGIIVGPSVLDLVSRPMLDSLEIINGMATALIALSAGKELGYKELRPLLRTIGSISVCGLSLVIIMLAAVILATSQWVPFLAELAWGPRIAVSITLAVVMSAQSPSVVIAMRDEMQARGPVASTAMGIVIIADLAVIVLFAITSAIAKSTLGVGDSPLASALAICWELLGSIAFGASLGLLLAVFLKRVSGSAALFVMLLAFVIAEIGKRLALDPLILALSAGLVVRNFSEEGEKLHGVITAAGLPVYVLFFAVAGASLHIDALKAVGLLAPVFALTRATGLLSGGKLGAKVAGAAPAVQRFAPYGLLPQAGLALALSHLMSRTFPSLGAQAGALTLAIVALNELIAPVVYRWALVKSGEGNPAAAVAAGGH
jgi:Kef-type K+ transport system membrane component KefB